MGPGHPQLRVLQQALFSGTQDFTLQRMIGDHLNMDDLHLGGWVSNVVTKRKPEPQSAGSIQSICVRMKCVTCHVSRVTCLLSDTAALNIGDEEIMACMETRMGAAAAEQKFTQQQTALSRRYQAQLTARRCTGNWAD